jgi:hypothetical protein
MDWAKEREPVFFVFNGFFLNLAIELVRRIKGRENQNERTNIERKEENGSFPNKQFSKT